MATAAWNSSCDSNSLAYKAENIDDLAFDIKNLGRGAWVAQLVKCQTLGFSSGHDFTVCEMESRDWSSDVCSSDLGPGWLSWLSVRLLISAQVMISQFCEFKPHRSEEVV